MRILYHPRKLARVKYGLLYNWYAATDVRNIAPAGWHVPNITEYQALADYLGAGGNYNYNTNTVGGKLKETGLTYWDTPNEGATNETGFTARGSGNRESSFANIKSVGIYWTTFVPFPNTGCIAQLAKETESFQCASMIGQTRYYGYSIRLIKDDSTDTGTMIGNDGKIYPTVKIGTQVWMAANLAETEYRNGNAIPEVTDNSAWISLTSGALCAYNNDWGNV